MVFVINTFWGVWGRGDFVVVVAAAVAAAVAGIRFILTYALRQILDEISRGMIRF